MESAFSKTQMRQERPRCRDCVAGKIAASHEALGHLCTRCGWLPAGLFPPSPRGLCTACQSRAISDRSARDSMAANIAARTVARGACRVRDVKKRYGHLCEIPLQAYQEAGVAEGRNDLVTEADVQAASDAWDARSILHEIDTQWGDMPGGGAYKDSNHYYGPGEYDYY